MASGRYGAYDLQADVPQSIATGQTDRWTALSISVVNRGNTDAKISIGIGNTVNVLNNEDFIEKDTTIGSTVVLERTGIAIKVGQYITIISDSDNVSAVAWGVESGDPTSYNPVVPNVSFVDAITNTLPAFNSGITVNNTGYQGNATLQFNGTPQAVYEKAFATALTGDWSFEMIFKPSAANFTANEDKAFVASIGALSSTLVSNQRVFQVTVMKNSGSQDIASIGKGDNTDGIGNWSSTANNIGITANQWHYFKQWYDGTTWQVYLYNIDTQTAVLDQGGITPEAGDHEGFVMGKAPFGDLQLPVNGSALAFDGQIAMVRVANPSIQTDPAVSGIPNYVNTDVTANDKIFFVRKA